MVLYLLLTRKAFLKPQGSKRANCAGIREKNIPGRGKSKAQRPGYRIDPGPGEHSTEQEKTGLHPKVAHL